MTFAFVRNHFLLALSHITCALLSGVAQAFEVKCASPNQPVILQGGASRRAIRPRSHSSTRAGSPQAAVARERGASLGTCAVRVGRAKLGGDPGILITAIDARQRKASFFCRGVTPTDCLVRTAQAKAEPTAWSRASLTKVAIARGQFAYRIEKENTGVLVIILFGPDITAYLR